ncbi:MAG: D-alanyl-D-alanine carboxypeptidase [Rickettsiaceae bacterium]|jgi:D-alanyl-D-alanine carboxypeptidase (penicillin-binding protein 5/6)|nr:D-alanyl-D-alanine carboxypeptidase [Rickettsiaceae bacterium]
MKVNIISRIVSLILVASVSFSAYAAPKKSKRKAVAPINPIASSIIVDANTGEILHFENADKLIFPASLTKVMTLYLTFEAIENGKLRLNQYIPISPEAAAMPAMRLGLKAGERVRVKDLIMAVALNSANDAARALGEAISGSEDLFARKMTVRAKQLGMYNTTFKNASGWHHSEQKTNAMDLAKLAIAIKRDFPLYYPIFSETKFNYKGRTIYSHNHVTKQYAGAEGLKTGYTRPSGFNLVTSATKNGRKLIGVVTGGRSARERDLKMMALLDKHFGVTSQVMQSQKSYKKKALASKSTKSVKAKSKRKISRKAKRTTA